MTKPSNFRRYLDIPNDDARLTPKQVAVCRLAREGYTDHEIGERLGLAYETVCNHLWKARKKVAQ